MQLRFDVNTDAIVKNGQQRIFLLGKLNSSNIRTITCLFYKSFIESVFDCFIRLLATVAYEISLNDIVQVCSKIIGEQEELPLG